MKKIKLSKKEREYIKRVISRLWLDNKDNYERNDSAIFNVENDLQAIKNLYDLFKDKEGA